MIGCDWSSDVCSSDLGEGPTVDSTFDYEEFRNYLDGIGDSLLVVNDDEIIKVHVHTEKIGRASCRERV